MDTARQVGIVTDSTADIPRELARHLEISVVPAILTVDGESFKDGEEMSRREFYRRMPFMSQPPTTAVPSMKTFEETYQACFDAGARSVLAITVSSRLSGMFDTATLAGEAFGDRVHVFDSQQISLGLGFQVIEAAIDAQRGNSLPSLLANAERILPRVGVIAMINSLEYLKRSGRVSWLRAGVGDILRIKLLIGLEEGTVVQIGRARTRKNALQQVVDTAASWGPLSRLAVLHSGIPDEATLMADTLKHLASTQPFVVDVTTVIGAHVGPESIGLAVLRE